MLDDYTYKIMKKSLFPNAKKTNYLHHFLDVKLDKNHKRDRNFRHTKKPVIIHGTLDYFDITLKPTPTTITTQKHSFEKEIFYIYNNEYWLIQLWLRMFNDALGDNIAKEIVRAFIKNCISETTKDLLALEKERLTYKDIKKGNLSTHQKYFSNIFNIGQIIRKMRKPIRDKLKNKYIRQRKYKNNSAYYTKCNRDQIELIQAIFKAHNLTEYDELIEISKNTCDNKDFKTGVKFLLNFLNNTRRNSLIKKEIKNIIQ